jgi:hypothetical protein
MRKTDRAFCILHDPKTLHGLQKRAGYVLFLSRIVEVEQAHSTGRDTNGTSCAVRRYYGKPNSFILIVSRVAG